MGFFSLDDKSPKVPAKDSYWVADSATIIGAVILEEDVSVWFGSVIRGDNETIRLCAGSNIQDMCMLHTDPGYPLIVGEGCTIGHRAILHGCTIGKNSLVGMGATILNGAKIGNNCIIGANALIPERKEIPDNSLVIGVPGKVVKTINEGAVAALRVSATGYKKNWRRFSTGLKPFTPHDE